MDAAPAMDFLPDQTVKTCSRIESGLRLGIDGIRACCFGVLVSPLYWSAGEAATQRITKQMIMDTRRRLFMTLNDEHSDISCKSCLRVELKKFSEISFDRLGFIDLAHFTTCNLRCDYCGFTKSDNFEPPKYDALAILRQFSADEVDWDSCVDFNGGEPSLLHDLDEYIDYFKSRKIRVRLYSNGLRFRQSIYDALADGTISSLIVSLDAGTPSTYKKTKRSDKFIKVIENLGRYSEASNHGNGALGVKYVFTQSNSGEDDIAGFTCAMLAIRPQKVYLGFDFISLNHRKHESSAVLSRLFASEIDAYAKTFLLFRQYGLTPTHFFATFAAVVTQYARDLMTLTLARIDELARTSHAGPQLRLIDFRASKITQEVEAIEFRRNVAGGAVRPTSGEPWTWQGTKLFLAPATPDAVAIAHDLRNQGATILGLLDRNPQLHGRLVQGISILGYAATAETPSDLVLIVSEFHQEDIRNAVACHAPNALVGVFVTA